MAVIRPHFRAPAWSLVYTSPCVRPAWVTIRWWFWVIRVDDGRVCPYVTDSLTLCILRVFMWIAGCGGLYATSASSPLFKKLKQLPLGVWVGCLLWVCSQEVTTVNPLLPVNDYCTFLQLSCHGLPLRYSPWLWDHEKVNHFVCFTSYQILQGVVFTEGRLGLVFLLLRSRPYSSDKDGICTPTNVHGSSLNRSFQHGRRLFSWSEKSHS